MTKEEIKNLVDAGLRGQGDQIDSGGVLAKVLNEIVDKLPEGGGSQFRLQGPLTIPALIEDGVTIVSGILAEGSAEQEDYIAKYAQTGDVAIPTAVTIECATLPGRVDVTGFMVAWSSPFEFSGIGQNGGGYYFICGATNIGLSVEGIDVDAWRDAGEVELILNFTY